jgi:hypothetical protein
VRDIFVAFDFTLEAGKRREWEERLAQFRASGLTVARFCAHQGVNVNTFYYWSKRVGKRSTTPRAAASSGVDGSAGRGSLATTGGERIHFHLAAGVEVSVPAHCLDVIRCLAESVQRSGAAGRASVGGEAFHEVVLGSR